ncbi:MAG: mitochondrial fission ELM1 family protein [Alphaproteobacteria bacterium]
MKKLWLLLDNRMGSVGQAKGVALKLEKDFEIIEKQINYNRFAKLPNILKFKSLIGIKKESKTTISQNFPDLIISASRRTAPVAQWIKKQSPTTKIIQLMHPGNYGLKDFDLVFVPHHDKGHRKETSNITYIFGAPHRLSQQKLKEAKQQWQKTFAHLPQPLTAVLVGGGASLNEENATKLGKELKTLKNKFGGSILITTSKRTGEKPTQLILNEIKDIPSHQYIWGQTQDQENPFMGYLACADNVVVTGDSVSMPSEACGTSKPVFIFLSNYGLKTKQIDFVKSLCNKKYACLLNDENAHNFKPQTILDTAKFIADKTLTLF